MFLYLLVLISLINQSINAQCPSSYTAPYQLSTTKTLTVNSAVFDGGKYYIQICGSVDVSYCPYSAGQQQCFATTTWEVVSDGLGDPANTAWSPNGASDWSGGAIAENNDIAYDYDQCNADPSTNMFKVTYFCQNGDDSVAIVSEPSISKNDPCRFEFRVDSSVVCAHGGGGTSTGGPTPSSSGQPGPGPEDGGSKKGLSGGWIFTIILIVVFSVYLFGGIAWNRMRKGLSGAEMIPNKDFWAGLPGLVKDGCIFFVQKCKGLCGRGGGGGGSTSTAFM